MERIFIIMTELVECLRAELTASALPVPAALGVIPGEVVIADYTAVGTGSECDFGWVRLASAYPSSTVGIESQEVGNCNKGAGWDIEIGLLRCIGQDDDVPTIAEATAATGLQISDMAAMHRAVACCPTLNAKDQIIGRYTPRGPEGGFVGGFWTVYVGG